MLAMAKQVEEVVENDGRFITAMNTKTLVVTCLSAL